MIPKIIHYCWLSNDPIPSEMQKYMDTWKKHLPDYEFMLWNFDRFPKSMSKWVSDAFDNKKYAFAADYIRLYALYTYGGIYLDMDVEVVKSFDPLLSSNNVIGYESEIGIEAGIIGAEKNSRWVKLCLDYYIDRSFIKDNGEFDTRPLPYIIYDILSENSLLGTEIRPLSYDFLTAKSYKTNIITVTSNTYSIHHFAGSWLSPRVRLKGKLRRLIGDENMQKLVKIKQTLQKFLQK